MVRRVLTNILDRVDVEEDREKTKRKRKKVKRGPARSAEEREHIRYLSKLDILLCRRKVIQHFFLLFISMYMCEL